MTLRHRHRGVPAGQCTRHVNHLHLLPVKESEHERDNTPSADIVPGAARSVRGRVLGRRGEHRHAPTLPAQHDRPELRRVRAERVVGREIHDQPAAGRELELELARRPPRVPDEDPQPAIVGAYTAGSRSRSRVPRPSNNGWKTGPSPRPSPITAVGATGPPMKRHAGAELRSAQSGSTSATESSMGRFRTTPRDPSAPCSSISTTVREKFGSRRSGVATSSRPRTDSVMGRFSGSWVHHTRKCTNRSWSGCRPSW